MDLSALIFVALAVAWAVYLIPKALKHHEDAQQSRAVEGFSGSMRVLATREPVDAKTAALVVPGRPSTEAVVPPVAARAAAKRAAKRRLRVVLLILAGNVAVAVLAYLGYLTWSSQAIPAGVLVAWLVACRLMVKKERAAAPARAEVEPVEAEDAGPDTEEIAAVPAAERDPNSWDPVPVTLPTYVDKAEASRSVRTIDLDSTGVWSSGRSESDSRIARAADEAAREAKQGDADERRAANDG